MQGSARKDVVFGAAGVYPVTVPEPKWKSWPRLDDFPRRAADLELVVVAGLVERLQPTIPHTNNETGAVFDRSQRDERNRFDRI